MINKIAIVFVGILVHMSSGVPLDSNLETPKRYDTRIVGGQEAAPGRAPHMAALVVGYVFKSLTCGGSIISPHHVLTAAHCIASYVSWDGTLLDSLHVVVGSNSWLRGTDVKIRNFRNHQEYDPTLIKNDIGILITEEIEMKGRVAVIALDFSFVDGGVPSYVTGWGTQTLWGSVPELLRILYVNTLGSAACISSVHEMAASQGWWAPPVDPRTEICTLHSPGHGMCHGDSGSALVSVSSGLQSGIVSWGVPCAVGGPDVFVRVAAFKDFIRNVLKTFW